MLKAPNHLTGLGEQSCDFLSTPITKYRCPIAGADEQFTSALVNATTVYLTLDNFWPKRAKKHAALGAALTPVTGEFMEAVVFVPGFFGTKTSAGINFAWLRLL